MSILLIMIFLPLTIGIISSSGGFEKLKERHQLGLAVNWAGILFIATYEISSRSFLFGGGV